MQIHAAATAPPATSPPAISPPPDWQGVARNVLCPLCDYDLRGLTDPRCPECGYQFAWRELLDPTVGLHPYLFEHHPHRQRRAFVRTWIGHLRPGRFWRSIAPTQPISAGRLLRYWLIVATLILLVGLGGRLAVQTAERVSHDAGMRQMWLQQYRNPADPGKIIVSPGQTLQQMLDRYHPPLTRIEFWINLMLDESDLALAIPFLLAAAAWPALTLATLLIFIASIQRARIKWAHVLRCSVYCADAFLLLVPVALLPAPPLKGVGIGVFLLSTIVTWRLIVAFRIYLRFRHAAATVLASQVIVLLLVVTVLLQNDNAYELLFAL